ncbi:protein kinase domain-containing protein [Subtercola sp. RTI3]|uniref:protein kinase domain-containing protein n=1 Tax=Subtercola sp. RTI3 TaxID=3048639 RepID=UPI002B23BA71|nr:protein kinase [Subtercola sp. RTI3]MEA9984361.1 protein kinase [Subtercola sp. RTI3]
MSEVVSKGPSEKVLGGRYRLGTPVGQGGMATVFRARDEILGREVAVKLFTNSAADAGREEGELAVLASLDHHALVQLYDAGIDRDEYGRAHRYIVMALVNGSDLHDRVGVSALSARHIAEIGYDMAEALDYIHAHNVIHRDIKPSNILVVDYGDGSPRARAKLTDFGVALTADIERMTAEGATTGTAAYLSPEQASGRPVGPASDVYALGLVLLECFTRSLEYPGSVVESAIARLRRDPVIPAELPDYWRQLLGAMTARNPLERPVRHELVAILKQVVIAESGRHKDEVMHPLFDDDEKHPSLAPRPSVLDTLPDEALDRVTVMAARLFAAPICIISVLDHDRVWLKTHYDTSAEQTAAGNLNLTLTAQPQSEPVVIEDTMLDSRSSDSSLVTGDFGMRFYTSVPLKRSSGTVIGTLCVIDFEPHAVSNEEVENLNDLAALVVSQLELRHVGMRTTSEIRVNTAPPVAALAPLVH